MPASKREPTNPVYNMASFVMASKRFNGAKQMSRAIANRNQSFKMRSTIDKKGHGNHSEPKVGNGRKPTDPHDNFKKNGHAVDLGES